MYASLSAESSDEIKILNLWSQSLESLGGTNIGHKHKMRFLVMILLILLQVFFSMPAENVIWLKFILREEKKSTEAVRKA